VSPHNSSKDCLLKSEPHQKDRWYFSFKTPWRLPKSWGMWKWKHEHRNINLEPTKKSLTRAPHVTFILPCSSMDWRTQTQIGIEYATISAGVCYVTRTNLTRAPHVPLDCRTWKRNRIDPATICTGFCHVTRTNLARTDWSYTNQYDLINWRTRTRTRIEPATIWTSVCYGTRTHH